MQLTTTDVKHIANLSRLELQDSELENYRNNLMAILDYVDKLASVDTDGIPEFVSVSDSVNVWRTDEAKPCDLSERESVIKSFPHCQGSLLEVSAVFEGRTE